MLISAAFGVVTYAVVGFMAAIFFLHVDSLLAVAFLIIAGLGGGAIGRRLEGPSDKLYVTGLWAAMVGAFWGILVGAGYCVVLYATL